MLNSDLDLDTQPSLGVATSKSPSADRLVTKSGIESSISIPIFAEATALALRLTDSPVAILSTIDGSGYEISSICGLEKFVCLPEQADLCSELSGLEYCHAQAICSEDAFIAADIRNCPQLSQSSLAGIHGIRAYLGVPIVTAAKDRLGALSILDFNPRQFGDRDIELLQSLARLVASEFERKLLSQAQLNWQLETIKHRMMPGFDDLEAVAEHQTSRSSQHAQDVIARQPLSVAGDPHHLAYARQGEIKFKLLNHLAKELRTPLTSVLGMASVLQQEIYGSLSSKQKDYVGIVYHSSRQLVEIVDEIDRLGEFDRHQHKLTLQSVDLDMLCQLAIQNLEPLAHKKQQQIILDLTGGNLAPDRSPERFWLLDKDKVRQIVYQLSLSLIHATADRHQISIRLAHLTDGLQIHISTSDSQAILGNLDAAEDFDSLSLDRDDATADEPNIAQDLRIRLGLSLSHNLAAAHGGKIEFISQGLGYQLSLPLIVADEIS